MYNMYVCALQEVFSAFLTTSRKTKIKWAEFLKKSRKANILARNRRCWMPGCKRMTRKIDYICYNYNMNNSRFRLIAS